MASGLNMLSPFLYGLIACVASVSGSLVALKGGTNEKLLKRFTALSGGMLLSSAFLRVIPEALHLNRGIGTISLLLFFLFFYALEDFMIIHSCPEHTSHCETHIIGNLAFLGLGLHSLVDGIAVGSSFRFSPSLGVTTSFAVIFHKWGDGLALSSLLLAGNTRKRGVISLSLAISLFTLLGAFLSFVFTGVSSTILASLLGISGASFLYISTSDLLPQLHRERDLSLLFFLVIGIIFTSILTAVFPGE